MICIMSASFLVYIYFSFICFGEIGSWLKFLAIMSLYILATSPILSSPLNNFWMLNLFQARRRENHETYMSIAVVPPRGNNIRLVWHSLAEKILQFWVWSLQHVMEENWCLGSCWLPLGEFRSICFKRLDPSRSYNSRVHTTQLPFAYLSKYILLQLCYQAY